MMLSILWPYLLRCKKNGDVDVDVTGGGDVTATGQASVAVVFDLNIVDGIPFFYA